MRACKTVFSMRRGIWNAGAVLKSCIVPKPMDRECSTPERAFSPKCESMITIYLMDNDPFQVGGKPHKLLTQLKSINLQYHPKEQCAKPPTCLHMQSICLVECDPKDLYLYHGRWGSSPGICILIQKSTILFMIRVSLFISAVTIFRMTALRGYRK